MTVFAFSSLARQFLEATNCVQGTEQFTVVEVIYEKYLVLS
jgi:hypothetical protein